jgi:hypothetical protein
MSNQETIEFWGIVELFGHQQIAGKVSEQTVAGQGFVRVDVPAIEDQMPFSKLYGSGAIYAITPVTEEIALAYMRRNAKAPISIWELALPEKVRDRVQDDEEDDE